MNNISNSTKKELKISEKIDLQTNNPRKLYRTISDFCEIFIVTKNYVSNGKKEPTLEKTGIQGVAEFEGNIDVKKTLKSRTISRIITGIFLILIGGVGFLFGNSLMELINYTLSELLQYGWIVLSIIGLIIIFSKAKTELIIEIELKGESYQYKGNKQIEITEQKQRLDVVSDIRITITGFLADKSHYKEKYAIQLKQDVQFIKEKLDGIVPEYRIPE